MDKILSIIIVNWNGLEVIKHCIESIFTYYLNEITDGKFEVIVIDNDSKDGSKKYLSSLSGKILVIENISNLGYASAANQGMKKANGRYILLLGNDTKFIDNSLYRCIEFLDNNKHCGAVGCKLLNTDRTVQNSCKKFPKLKNAFYTYLSLDRMNGEYDMADFNYDQSIEVEQIATTFLMIRKNILEQINYFDEKYRIMYNDVDLCSKIIYSGNKIYFLHTASVIHYGSYTTKRVGYTLRKQMYGDIYRYYKNNFGYKAKFLYPILVFRLLIVTSIKM